MAVVTAVAALVRLVVGHRIGYGRKQETFLLVTSFRLAHEAALGAKMDEGVRYELIADATVVGFPVFNGKDRSQLRLRADLNVIDHYVVLVAFSAPLLPVIARALRPKLTVSHLTDCLQANVVTNVCTCSPSVNRAHLRCCTDQSVDRRTPYLRTS